MTKRLLFLILTVILVSEVWTNRQRLLALISYSPCNSPIGYHLGTLDPRFKITPSELLNDTKMASGIWDKSYGKELFTYDPKSKLAINLVYDERQSLSTQIQNLGSELKNEKSPLTSALSQYQAQAADFQKRLNDLNSQIDYWNAHGGAPQDVYNQLISQQSDLKALADKLNATAQSLNLSAQKYNINVSTFNQTLDSFKVALQAKPEEGLYKGGEEEIDIYLTQDQNELVHTLAHEMGHALGLPHNQDKDSIMYPMTSETLVTTKDDLASLAQVCKSTNIAELLYGRLREHGL